MRWVDDRRLRPGSFFGRGKAPAILVSNVPAARRRQQEKVLRTLLQQPVRVSTRTKRRVQRERSKQLD